MLPAELHFLRPYWFYALIPLTLLLWRLWSRHARRSRWQDVCDQDLIEPLLTDDSGSRRSLPLALLGLGWLLAVLALAGPSWTALPQPVVPQQQARVIMLDLSRSMDATDLKPSRLAQARFKALDLLNAIDEGQTGLIAYAAEPFTVSPLTDDSATIAALLPSLDTDIMPAPGTRTDLALAHAVKLLQQAGVQRGHIILIGDGVSPLPASLEQAHMLRAAGHRLSVLAVGTTIGAPIPTAGGGFLSDASGAIVMPRLDSNALAELAAAGGGQLVALDNGRRDIDRLLSAPLLSLATPLTTASPFDRIDPTSSLQADRWREEGPWLLLLLLPLAALGLRRGWLGVVVLGLLLPLYPATPLQAAEVGIDRETVLMDETLHLTLSIPGAYRGEPDFSALKQDFEILGTNRSSRINIINGQKSTLTEWHLTLAPRRTGTLSIPPIEVGGEFSNALKVVAKPAATPDGKPRDLFIELSTEPESPYVQAQLILVMRIFHAVSLQDAGVSEPEVGDTPMQRMGEDRAYRSNRNGRHYRVIERRYALFPQRSGVLEIAPLTLTAQVRVNRNGSQGSRFGNSLPFGGIFQQTRTMRVRSNALKLTIHPRPADIAQRDWLPAQSIDLDVAWSPEPPVFRVGEPVTRTVTLTARGIGAVQLPDLEVAPTNGLRLYADRPISADDSSGATIISRKVFKTALVASAAGPLTLPGLVLNWFDTDSGEAKRVTVPARQIEVLPATTAPATVQATTPPPAMAKGPAGSADATTIAPGLSIPAALSRYGVNGLSLLLAMGWLLTLLLWLRHARKRVQAPTQSPPTRTDTGLSASQARAMLRRGCRDDNPALARDALLGWATNHWPDAPPHSLGDLARRLPQSEATDIIQALDQLIYRPNDQTDNPRSVRWRGNDCAKTLGSLMQSAPKADKPNTKPLPALYPQR